MPAPGSSPFPEVVPGDAVIVPQLTIAAIPADLPAYSRDDWKHWNDTDSDCQNTRAEVLIAESTTDPTFATDRQCRVTGGLWEGPYTGETFTAASDLDIDHLVPLKNAHLSGGWQWDADRKEEYANSMAADNHLVAVEKYANRSKGARGPEEWQPPDDTYHCQYARGWISVKSVWGLSATPAEWEALAAMLATCPYPVRIVDDAGEAAVLPRPDPDPEPPPPTIGGDIPASGRIVITEIMADPSAVRDRSGEWFEVHNPNGNLDINLRGWTIREGGGGQHRISEDIVVPAGGYVVLARNGDPAANGGIPAAYQYSDIALTNDEDSIELADGNGRVVDRVEYHSALVFPGASTSLSPDHLDAGANDDPDNWCRATSTMANGDHGSPDAANDAC
ncbi:MAG: lamin tail domain-containing protein [Chloroflexota bacterium]|nr:lamin tail domain-containing protein [Chloroflexota bacterium]